MRVRIFESKEDQERFKNWLRADADVLKDIESNFDSVERFFKFYRDYVTAKKITGAYADMSYLAGKNNDKYLQSDIFKEVLRLYNDIFSREEAKQQAKAGAEVIYPNDYMPNNGKWIVRKINTYEASAYYGRNTEWCVAGTKRWTDGMSGDYYFNSYHSRGVILYYYESTTEKQTYEIVDSESSDRTNKRSVTAPVKYAVSFSPYGDTMVREIWDAHDNRLKKLPEGAPDPDELARHLGDLPADTKRIIGEIRDLGYPYYSQSYFAEQGIEVKSCTFPLLYIMKDLQNNYPDIAKGGLNYLIDDAKFDTYDPSWFEDQRDKQREEDDKLIARFRDIAKMSEDIVSTGKSSEETSKRRRLLVSFVDTNGKIHTHANDLANDKQNIRPMLIMNGGLTKLKKANGDNLSPKVDRIEFIGAVWWVINDKTLLLERAFSTGESAEGVASVANSDPNVTGSAKEALKQLHTSKIWRDMEKWYRQQKTLNEGREMTEKNKLMEALNLDKPCFYDKKSNTMLKIDKQNKTFKTCNGTEKNLSNDYNSVDTTTLKAIVDIIKDAGYAMEVRKSKEDTEENLKEGKKVEKKLVLEEFVDLDKQHAKKYEGEPIYRITGLIKVDGRIQMYVIGLGERDTEKVNYFKPVIRSARYTTEESFIFLSEKSATEFFKEFKKNYEENEFNLKEFHVSEYHPFNEVTKIIPIDSPLGRAFVAEQKKIKKPYEEK